ncbi:hypothetical protein [Nonomuraea endophytica]|uniref:Uncharacterized protein n=1 Tax=Nonomuraea endophytica TaxID=714136 RepID=A0A7W8AC28_9ACTN|nr:hypothetical protein [Nonomuraea endophytica]MBB5082008.1 hypothetical protein [Nonomuraea endophytica]
MRRYRFGMIAALLALGFLALVVVLCAFTLADPGNVLLWKVVTRDTFTDELFESGIPWGLTLALGLIGVLQAWALWQVLRGRARGELTARGRKVGLLRLALYLSVGISLVDIASVPLIVTWEVYWVWYASAIVSGLLQLAVTWLFFLVLRDTASLGLRLFSLVTGVIVGVLGIGQSIAQALFLEYVTQFLNLGGMSGYLWPAWAVSILIAQGRDPRWSAATVRVGVVAQVVSVLQPAGSVSFGYFGYEIPFIMVIYSLLSAVGVLGLVWEARTAHELAGPLPRGPSPAPERSAARLWPLAVVAIVLPLVPAAVNLAQGRYHWIGPRGAIEQFIRQDSGHAVTWLGLDVFVGVGGPALLILFAVLRRTRRAVQVTSVLLAAAAAVGLVSALTSMTPASEEFRYEGTQIYPEGMFAPGPGKEIFFGISPLFYSAALLCSALILRSLYPLAPAPRARRHVLLAGLAAVVALGFVPAADQARGPVTTAEECNPYPGGRILPEGPELTRDQRIVCSLRQGSLIKFGPAASDAGVLTYARRLCDIYTRNDPQEVARLKAVDGLQRDHLAYPLAEICPSAKVVVKAAAAEQDREFQEWEAAAQRMCDATPRHRPLIKPAHATRVKEPQMTDYGVVETYEPTGDDQDPADLLDEAQDDGLVASLPGSLMVLTDPDFDICVTVETYTRRPPVETKGWDHVAEVGYESPTGDIVLRDDLSGTEFPDLSLNGRAGHYRIRVHYDWFKAKDDQEGQRLLIIAYPGKEKKPITYRKPPRR